VARGIFAAGQFGIGLFSVAQIGEGFGLGFGRFMAGLTAVARVAVTVLFGIGQFATGIAAVGQVVFAVHGFGQVGLAAHPWSTGAKDPEAARFFTGPAAKIGLKIGRWFHGPG
jgi:hypothetical protein